MVSDRGDIVRFVVAGCCLVIPPAALYGLGAGLVALAVAGLICASTMLRLRYAGGLAAPVLMMAETGTVTLVLFLGDPVTGNVPPGPMIFLSPGLLALICVMAVQAHGASPRLTVWSGACVLAAWAAARGWVLDRPDTLTRADVNPARFETLADYLVAITEPHYFSESVWRYQMAALAGVAVVFALAAYRGRRLVREATEKLAARTRLAEHFAPQIVQGLLNGSLRRDGEAQAAVLDCDLVGFTRAVATAPPEATAALLRRYHGFVEAQVFAAGGAILKFSGDGIVAVFGLTDPGPGDAVRARACAQSLVAGWPTHADPVNAPLGLAVGLDFGLVRWGLVAGARAGSLLILGPPIQGAARLQAATRGAGTPILASAAFELRCAAAHRTTPTSRQAAPSP